MKSLFILAFILLSITACNNHSNIYENNDNWVHLEINKNQKIDTFFLAPASATLKSTGGLMNMPINDEFNRERFKIQVNNEMGIYTDNTRFFAPYYSQAVLETYTVLLEKDREKFFSIAYNDVKQAFEYYLDHYNQGRPIILAGFSQGADMALRLINTFFVQEKYANLLVGCYAIGHLITDDYIKALPNGIHFANGEDDNKSIIGFNCEREDVDDTIIVPKNKKDNAINPLNWKRTNETVDESYNKGAKFFTSKGKIDPKDGRNKFDAKIDSTRGTIKVSKINKDDANYNCYPFKDGDYHVYDWQFYYSNLQQNVKTRINHFLNK